MVNLNANIDVCSLDTSYLKVLSNLNDKSFKILHLKIYCSNTKLSVIDIFFVKEYYLNDYIHQLSSIKHINFNFNLKF